MRRRTRIGAAAAVAATVERAKRRYAAAACAERRAVRTNERRGRVASRRKRAATDAERVDDADAASTRRHDRRLVGLRRRRHLHVPIDADDRGDGGRRRGARATNADATRIEADALVAMRTGT